jgi:hypothetical protein
MKGSKFHLLRALFSLRYHHSLHLLLHLWMFYVLKPATLENVLKYLKDAFLEISYYYLTHKSDEPHE